MTDTKEDKQSSQSSSGVVRSYVAEENERKFVLNELPKEIGESEHISQYYLSTGDVELRVRRREGSYTLTVKAGGSSQKRAEVERGISQAEYESLKSYAKCGIEKERYTVREGITIDYFTNLDLVIVEVESPATVPDWVGEEVTGEPSYYNARLAEAT